MKPPIQHHPGEPDTDDPPAALIEVLDRLDDPLVVQSGVTTTPDGRWALFVAVPREADVPLAGIERQAAGFPVVYQAAPLEAPIARPAFPGRGE